MAMNRSAFIAGTIVALLLASLAIGLQSVSLAYANPFFMFHKVDPVPGTIPPPIQISSPKDNITYSPENVTLSFNVDKPQLAGCRGAAIIGVEYILDGLTTQAFSIWRGGSASNSNAIPQYSTTVTLPDLSEGKHTLTVQAEGVVYVVDLDIFFISSSSTITFEVGTVQPKSNWVEVARFQGQQSTQTDLFTCNCTEWRISWQFDPGHWHFPELHGFTVETYPKGETVSYVDRINELANGNTVGWHLIRNNAGTFYMKISAGLIENYTVSVEQNLNSLLSVTSTMTTTPSPSPTPSPSGKALTASLSESASALNFGDKVNFTVSVEGGNAPYTYAWHLDGQLTETSASPYYVINGAAVGSHHVYVEVIDSDGNSATTLAVEFNVLETPSSSLSPSSSSAEQKTTTDPSPSPSNAEDNSAPLTIAIGLPTIGIAVTSLAYLTRKRGRKHG